jgi:hypothetical protein
MPKYTRQQVIDIIDTRTNEKIYGTQVIGSTWPFGIFKGKDITQVPSKNLYWHVLNNEELNQFQLAYARSRFEVCDWNFADWKDPVTEAESPGHYAGHYTGSSSGHYTGYK